MIFGIPYQLWLAALCCGAVAAAIGFRLHAHPALWFVGGFVVFAAVVILAARAMGAGGS